MANLWFSFDASKRRKEAMFVGACEVLLVPYSAIVPSIGLVKVNADVDAASVFNCSKVVNCSSMLSIQDDAVSRLESVSSIDENHVVAVGCCLHHPRSRFL